MAQHGGRLRAVLPNKTVLRCLEPSHFSSLGVLQQVNTDDVRFYMRSLLGRSSSSCRTLTGIFYIWLNIDGRLIGRRGLR